MKKNIINLFSLSLTIIFTLSACSDDFLEEKKNYDNVSEEIYNNYTGSNARVNDVYSWCLPDVNGAPSWKYNSTGSNDDQAKSTEEYSGFGAFVNPESPLAVLSGTSVPDYFQGTANNIQASAWGRIRNINDVIRGIEGGSLSQENKNKLLGQVYFFRAWCYYNFVKWYGGVPIITEVQETTESSYVPRSSAKACVDFIISDLTKAAEMLSAETTNGGWRSGDDWGRVTSGTALALKGRVLLMWASPLFNRANDETRWQNAYTEMKKDLTTINACGYNLYSTASNVNGSDFAGMFTKYSQNPEAVFVSQYNTVSAGNGQKNNSWERGIRPKNTTGSGKNASAMLIDMFPMADGKRPASCDTYTKLQASDSTYNEGFPFMARDPRFYRTFAFPGVRWAYKGDPTPANPNNPSYDGGTNYALWNYVWYTDKNDQGNPESGNSYGADNLLANRSGIYVRKRSDDLDVNNSPLYGGFDAANSNGGFAYSAAPYIELRYAEVLLNFAEVACGAGHMDEAVEQIKKVRARAGYASDNNYGLQVNLATDQSTCMSAVLYERQIEFAYEGKRFDDLRRWMLFDGGAIAVNGAPSSWTLTGWGGNTCTWLGFKPLNGQRRENFEFRVADSYGIGGTTFESDPLVKAGVTRCTPVDYRKADLKSQLETLKSWYETHLLRNLKKGDGRDSNHNDEYVTFFPRYYFLGLSQGALNNNLKIQQTIGWEDSNNGGSAGTFDPFAE